MDRSLAADDQRRALSSKSLRQREWHMKWTCFILLSVQTKQCLSGEADVLKICSSHSLRFILHSPIDYYIHICATNFAKRLLFSWFFYLFVIYVFLFSFFQSNTILIVIKIDI